MIGIPIWGSSIPVATMLSLVGTIDYCARLGVDVAIVTRQGAHVIARDALFEDFLTSNAARLFWIDSDMVWNPEDFLRLLGMSFLPGNDVMVAAYPAKKPGETLTFYANAGARAETTEPYGLVPVHGMGLGFAITSRKACEALAATKPIVLDQINGETCHEVFRFDTIGGNRRTEDMAFFADLAELGFQTWCDPSIELGHVGSREWRGRLLDVMPVVAQAAE